MKKITLVLMFVFVAFTSFGQRALGEVTIDGTPLDDWLFSINRMVETKTTYSVVVNFTEQEIMDNEIMVLFLTSGFGGTADSWSAPVTVADGSVTIEITPTLELSDGILQIRSTNSTGFGPDAFGASYTDNLFRNKFNVTENALSTNDIQKEDISDLIFPNPTSGALTVNVDSDSYRVYDLSGSLVIDQNNGDLNLSGLPNGLYLVSTDKGVSKVIKQ